MVSLVKKPSIVEQAVVRLATKAAQQKDYSTHGEYFRSRDLPKFISSKSDISRFLNPLTEAKKNYQRAVYNTCCNIYDLERLCRRMRRNHKSWAYDHVKHQYARRALEGERQILSKLLDQKFKRAA